MWADIQESLFIVLGPALAWSVVMFLVLGFFASITETWALLLKALTKYF